MQIVSAVFRYMRRVQVKDYEPLEAEMTVNVAFDEDEDVSNADLISALSNIKSAVHTAIQSKATVVAEASEATVTETGTKSRDEMTPAEKRADTKARKATARDAEVDAAAKEMATADDVEVPEASTSTASSADFDDDFEAPEKVKDDLDEIEGDIQNDFLLSNVNKAAEVLGGDGVRKILKDEFKVSKLGSIAQDMRRPFIRSLRAAVNAAKI